jgi:hypothetical protein
MLLPSRRYSRQEIVSSSICCCCWGVASKFSPVEEAGPLFGRDFKRTARGPTLFGEHCYEPSQCLIGPLTLFSGVSGGSVATRSCGPFSRMKRTSPHNLNNSCFSSSSMRRSWVRFRGIDPPRASRDPRKRTLISPQVSPVLSSGYENIRIFAEKLFLSRASMTTG